MKARDFLKQAYKIETKIHSMELQIEECKKLINRVLNLDSDKFIDNNENSERDKLVIKLKDYEESLKTNMADLTEIKTKINYVLEQLANEDYKALLKLRYLNYKNYNQISHALKKPYKLLLCLSHYKALKQVNKILANKGYV